MSRVREQGSLLPSDWVRPSGERAFVAGEWRWRQALCRGCGLCGTKALTARTTLSVGVPCVWERACPRTSRRICLTRRVAGVRRRRSGGPFSGIKDQRRAQKNDLRHFSEKGNRGAAQVSRRTARRGAGAGQNQQSKGVGVFQRGFAGKPAPTFRTGASPWGAAPRGCRSICHAAHPRSHRYSAKDNPRPARRTPARPIPSATHPAAATSARQCG